MIDEYFQEIEEYISHSIIVIKSEIEKIKLDDFSGIIKGRLYFKNDVLDFIEVINLKNNKLRNTDLVKFFLQISHILLYKA